MTIHVVGIATLLIIFLIGTLSSVNLGAIGFVAAFFVGGMLLNESPDEILAGLPGDLFMLIVGVTYLFSLASVNGTMDWFTHKLVGLVRGNAAAVPPLLFLMVSVATSAGALAPSVCAIFAPVALRVARQLEISRVLVGVMVAHGAIAGAFTPIGGLGPLVNGVVQRNGIDLHPLTLFTVNYAYNLVLAAIAYLVLGGVRQLRRTAAPTVTLQAAAGTAAPAGSGPAGEATADDVPPRRLDSAQTATVVGIVVLAVGLLGFGLDIGLLSITIAVALQLFFPASSRGALNGVSWGVMMLICGVVTYVEVLKRSGTIDALGEGVAGLHPAILGALMLSGIAAVTSAFASSAGLLAAMIPLAVPLVMSGELGGAAVIVAIAVCAVAVDVSPFSSTAALIVANADAEEQNHVFRGMFRWALWMIVTAPVATCLILVLPGWF